MKTCLKHPKYEGKKAPTSGCKECMNIWHMAIMAEPEKITKIMTRDQHTLEELSIDLHMVRFLRDNGYRVMEHSRPDGHRVYYVIDASELTSLFISGRPKKGELVELKWIELSDIHTGSTQFDERGLRDILNRGREEGFTQAHISGDLHDGTHIYRGHARNLRYHTSTEQADYLAEILKDYPEYWFIASTGNHDVSFVHEGGTNPIALLQDRVPNVTFLNSFAADLIIGGVAKRMVHIDGGRAYARSYPAQTYIRNLFASGGEHVWVQGNKYRLRFLQVGHLHFDVAFSEAGVKVTHPGNFQFPNDYTVRRGLVGPQGARFTTVTVDHDGRIVDYTSKFAEPRR
jgi:hypothetical protein